MIVRARRTSAASRSLNLSAAFLKAGLQETNSSTLVELSLMLLDSQAFPPTFEVPRDTARL